MTRREEDSCCILTSEWVELSEHPSASFRAVCFHTASVFNVMAVLLTCFFSRLSCWGLSGGNQQIPVTEGSKLTVAFPSLLSYCIKAGLCHLSCWCVWAQTFLTGSVTSLRGIRTTQHHNQPSHVLLFSHVRTTVGVMFPQLFKILAKSVSKNIQHSFTSLWFDIFPLNLPQQHPFSRLWLPNLFLSLTVILAVLPCVQPLPILKVFEKKRIAKTYTSTDDPWSSGLPQTHERWKCFLCPVLLTQQSSFSFVHNGGLWCGKCSRSRAGCAQHPPDGGRFLPRVPLVQRELVLSIGFLVPDERAVENSSFTLMIIATSQRSSWFCK